MKLNEKNKRIVIGAATILWGVGLLVYGPFYSRGYPVPRSIGVLVVLLGICYLIFYFRGNKKKDE